MSTKRKLICTLPILILGLCIMFRAYDLSLSWTTSKVVTENNTHIRYYNNKDYQKSLEGVLLNLGSILVLISGNHIVRICIR